MCQILIILSCCRHFNTPLKAAVSQYSVVQHDTFSVYHYRLLSILKRFSKIYYQALQNLGYVVIDYLKLFACIFTSV